ncbi:M16 family metallopeptidase [Rufibacter roseus]|uniref:Insulinase family protein n=1 Tax=Rufibacter roseus TaxID=1567108 RepID=A0ABW2DKQ2_9BACT|nr:pitrilysin family protein [Rufibacter roseus]
MKKILTYILPLALSLAACQKQPQTSATVDPEKAPDEALVVATMPFDVVELALPESDKVIVKLMFRNGSISDPTGKAGLTYATAQTIMAGGTQELTNTQIQEKIYPMAAQYGASVDKEATVFTFAVHKDFLNEFYPILKGLVLTPRFAEEDFNRVKSNQQNFVDQVIRSSSDEDYSKKALEDLLFRGTNYQHTPQGTSTGVKGITLEDVRNHYQNFFTRHNVTVSIAGNYSQDFLNRLTVDLEGLSGTRPNIPQPGKANKPDGIVVEIISKPNALGSAIFTGTPLRITRSSDDFAALMVANSYLGEHRKSYGQLYNKIRSTRSMNYGDYSYIEWYENGGSNMLPVPGVPRSSNYHALWIRPVQTAEGLKQQYKELSGIKVGHAHFALRLALREVDNMIKTGISKENFELTRQFLRSYNKLYIQTPEKRLGFLLDSHFYGRRDYIEDMDALLAKLTVEDVNQAIKKYWTADNLYVTIVTDDSEAQPLADALKNNTPSPMSYSNIVKEGLPQSVKDEDAQIANFKLNVKEVRIVDTNDTFR